MCAKILRDGIRLIEDREAQEKAKRRALRDAVQSGIDDIEAGCYRTFETPEAMRSSLTQLCVGSYALWQ
jgi:antitoxin ParD1/3/4